MSWARVLALVFLISFTISALLSLLILDELEDHATGRRVGPRAAASVVRHSMMPLTSQQIAYRQRLHALHFGTVPATSKDTLVSRRFPRRVDAAPADVVASSSPLPDDTDPAVQRDLVDGFEQFREAGSHHHGDPMSEAELNQALFDSIMGTDSSSALDSPHSADSHDSDADDDLLDEYHSLPSSGLSHEDASLLFGGAGGGSFEGLSLWSLLWRGLGVDLASWNTDISNVTHTFSKHVPKGERYGGVAAGMSQQQKREEYQRQQLLEQAQAAAKDNPQFAGTAASAAASAADSASPPTPSAAASSATPSPSSPRSPAPSARARRPAAPSSSVLSSLHAHQGIQPYFSMMDGFQTAQLCLVHSILEAPSMDIAEQRMGLVEWFSRPAAPFLFPLATAPLPSVERPSTAESFQRDASFSAIHMLTGLDLDLLLNSFVDLPASGGSQFGSGTGGAAANGNTPRRQAVDGDWVLTEYARVPGMIHSSASTNTAGGANEEEEWLAVAYEHLPELNTEHGTAAIEEQGATEIRVWFQPNSTIGAAASDTSTNESTPQPQREAVVACETGSSRVCLTIRLPHLRTVTSMHLSSSRLAAPLESGVVPLTILYALRGDQLVFRSIEVQAQQQPRSDAQDGSEWILSWKHAASGPIASRRGFISQTVSLQPFVDAPSSDSPAVRKVVAAELNWAKGPVTLASSVAASSFNRWGISEGAAKAKRGKRGNAGYLQSFPPFSAGIYSAAKDFPQNALEDRVLSPSDAENFVAEGWVTSSKNAGLYGPDVHALSIHRGEEGTLLPLVTAASSTHRFLAFAQVPLIATVDSALNFDPVEIIHLEADTQFVGMAFNTAGTMLAIADNHQDVIVLRRSEEAANAKHTVETPVAATPVAATNSASLNESTQAAAGSAETPSSASTDAASSPPAAPVAPPASPSRRRHSWEVMMEVVLPGRLRQLSLLSVQIIDVPVPTSLQHDLQITGRVGEKTAPVLVMLMQGGVLATMQLQPIGAASAVASQQQQQQQQSAAPAGGSTFSNHFNHPPLSSQITVEAFHAFLAVHWDLLLIVLLVVTWLIYSLPRFNRLAAEAAQNALAAQPMQPAMLAPAPVRPRGILQALLFGNAPAQAVVNQLAANGNVLQPQQPQHQPQAAVAMHPLNPLAQARFAAASSAAARAPPPANAAPASASSASSSSSSAPDSAPTNSASSSSSAAAPSSPLPDAEVDAAPAPAAMP